jgi:hypothetical protein
MFCWWYTVFPGVWCSTVFTHKVSLIRCCIGSPYFFLECFVCLLYVNALTCQIYCVLKEADLNLYVLPRGCCMQCAAKMALAAYYRPVTPCSDHQSETMTLLQPGGNCMQKCILLAAMVNVTAWWHHAVIMRETFCDEMLLSGYSMHLQWNKNSNSVHERRVCMTMKILLKSVANIHFVSVMIAK